MRLQIHIKGIMTSQNWRALAILLITFVIACTGSASPASSPAESSPTASPEASSILGEPDVSQSPAAAPDSLLPTSTPTAQAKPTRVPVPGLPSNFLDRAEQTDVPDATQKKASTYGPPPDRDLYELAAQLSLHTDPDQIRRVVNPSPVTYSQGREDTFWLVDFRDMSVYQSDFELRLVSPSAYWYVEKGQSVLQRDLERAAQAFESRIYPQVTRAFGQEWSPGVDNDPHLNIVHAAVEGVAGYYNSSDEHPVSVYPYSNQRETIYINSRSLLVGGESYLEVLAHELQHAIQWNNDTSEETWINEGLSELAVSLAGYRSTSFLTFLKSPTNSLIQWPLDNANISAHYGGASLFMHYLWEHYSRDDDLRPMVSEPADGIAGIDSYLAGQGYDVTFSEVFGDWVVANILDEDQGIYGYRDLDVKASIGKSIDHFSEISSEIPQYSAEYVEIDSLVGPIRIRFDGLTVNKLLPVTISDHGCWWSNSGDSINSTLTRSIDLRGLNRATLNYQIWYSIEEGWDYGYVQVSEDEGRTWEILETPHTTPENPIGNSFGPGYTGDSHDWINEHIDLSSYTGREILVRFQYITDDAVNGAGLCFRNITSPEAGLLENDPHWRADGFVLTDNRVAQDYLVKVIQIDGDNQVSSLTLDRNNSGDLVIPNPRNLDKLVVAVAALAPHTLQPAPYTLTVEPAN